MYVASEQVFPAPPSAKSAAQSELTDWTYEAHAPLSAEVSHCSIEVSLALVVRQSLHAASSHSSSG